MGGSTVVTRCMTVCADLPTSRICSIRVLPMQRQVARDARSPSSSQLITAKHASSILCSGTAVLRPKITPPCSVLASRHFCYAVQSGQQRARSSRLYLRTSLLPTSAASVWTICHHATNVVARFAVVHHTKRIAYRLA